MSANSVVLLAFQVSLFFVVFGFGLTAQFNDLLYVFQATRHCWPGHCWRRWC